MQRGLGRCSAIGSGLSSDRSIADSSLPVSEDDLRSERSLPVSVSEDDLHSELSLPVSVLEDDLSSELSLPVSVSEDDLRSELSLLGFPAVPRHRLLQFKEDLEQLMRSRAALDSQSEKENVPSSSLLEDGSEWDKLSLWPLTGPGPLRQGQPDAYSKHTVSLGTAGQDKRRAPLITRKVLRKKSDGEVEVCDESSLSSEVEAFEDESLSVTEDEDSNIPSRRSSSSDCIKSFIRMPPSSLLEQYRHHSDPVSRYHDYKHSWNSIQRVLERSRKEVRWGVRERMMSAPPAPLPRPLPAQNTYVIPTDKKRYDLRWAIRHHLVHGQIPRSGQS